MAGITKILKSLVKPKGGNKPGRKRKTGRPTKEVKGIMDSKNVSKAEAEKILKDKNKKETKPKESKTSTAKEKATTIRKGKGSSEIRRLLKEQKADDMETSKGPRRRRVGPEYLADQYRVGEGVNAPALSKVKPPEKMSPAQRRRRVTQGIVGGPRPQKKANSRVNVSDIGEFAPPSRDVLRSMRGDKGDANSEPSDLDILKGNAIDPKDFANGFEIRKGGGQIIYKKKGGPIGVGAARTGFGKVRS